MHSNLLNIIYAWNYLLLFLQLSDTILHDYFMCTWLAIYISCAVNKLVMLYYSDYPSHEHKRFHGKVLLKSPATFPVSEKTICSCYTPLLVLSIYGLSFPFKTYN